MQARGEESGRKADLLGLYAGLLPKLLQSVLTAAFMFVAQRRIYEMVKSVSPSHVLHFPRVPVLLVDIEPRHHRGRAYSSTRSLVIVISRVVVPGWSADADRLSWSPHKSVLSLSLPVRSSIRKLLPLNE